MHVYDRYTKAYPTHSKINIWDVEIILKLTLLKENEQIWIQRKSCSVTVLRKFLGGTNNI